MIVRVTGAEFDRFAPNARQDYRDFLVGNMDAMLERFEINKSALRLCHFMAQAAHECRRFEIRRESMTYRTTARILEIFGVGHHSAAITPAEAPTLVNQPKALAERVYGLGNPHKARELGNTQAGDGFKFRGAGFLQITGRGSYVAHGSAIGVDLTVDAEKAADADVSLGLACEEWKAKKCNLLADADDIKKVTKAINGGLNGLPERQALLGDAQAIWGSKKPT